MKTKSKTIMNKIIKYLLIFLSISIVLSFILYALNYRFSTWLIIFLSMAFLLVLTLIVANFIIFKTKIAKKPKIVAITLVIFAFARIANYPIKYFASIKEHMITMDNIKYIAIVKSDKYTSVSYYRYYSPFLVGLNEEIHGDFGEGNFDPYEKNKSYEAKFTYYDKEGKQTKEITRTINSKTSKEDLDINKDNSEKNPAVGKTNESIVDSEQMKVLYEKQFGNTILRFINADYVLGQNQLVLVEKSTDKGKTFKTMTDSPIEVSNEAEFAFINENIGYVISTGYLDVRNHCSGLYVTIDGGKTFQDAEFIYDKEDTYYIAIEDFPYTEKGTLKINCSVYDDNDTIFVSKDKGLTWKLEK